MYPSAVLPSEFFSRYKSHYFTFLFKNPNCFLSTCKVSSTFLVWRIRAFRCCHPSSTSTLPFPTFPLMPYCTGFSPFSFTLFWLYTLFSTRNSIPYPITTWQTPVYPWRPNSLDTCSVRLSLNLPTSASPPPPQLPYAGVKSTFPFPDSHSM